MNTSKKEITIRTNKAIMYLWDLKTNEPRRILFGDPEELYEFFVDESAYIHERLMKMKGKSKSRPKLEEAIVESREGFEKENASGVVNEDQILELSYAIVTKKT